MASQRRALIASQLTATAKNASRYLKRYVSNTIDTRYVIGYSL